MRIAWLGPPADEQGGVATAETHLIAALADEGAEVDCFFAMAEDDVPSALRARTNVRVIARPTPWQWNRWYSRNPLLAFVTAKGVQAAAQELLIRALLQRHERRSYDAVYQFSQIELFGLRRHLRRLPPIVLHPETHAAAALRWHRRERHLARRCEHPLKTGAARAILVARSLTQRRDAGRVERVVAPSRRFATHLVADYGLRPEQIAVVPNPIDLEKFRPRPRACANGSVLTLLFVSRMSVLKGVELVVELSHRLADLEGSVRIVAVGEHTLWSDYRCLLRDLHPAIAEYPGARPWRELVRLYGEAAALLQPSHYDAFALTVGEALASGLPVVASDAVGAAEDIDSRCCRSFPAGSASAFEQEVRRLVDDLRRGQRVQLSALARQEAERLFAPTVVGRRLAAVLEDVASGRSPEVSSSARPKSVR